jgi:hypothetical protein
MLLLVAGLLEGEVRPELLMEDMTGAGSRMMNVLLNPAMNSGVMKLAVW